MNPLSEYPHLFANGQFEMQVNIYPESEKRAIGTITCYSFPGACGIGALKVDGLGWVAAKKDGRNPKLIARPIEDMTDEERNQWELKKTYRVQEDDYVPSPESFLYALSVGCLPMKFRHCFGDTVIDTRTLKTA